MKYIVKANSIVLMYDDETHVIADDHPNFNRIREAIFFNKVDEIKRLSNISKSIEEFADGHIKIFNGIIYYEGQEVHNSVSYRILQMMSEGFNVKPMINFLFNLMKNPLQSAIAELYDFLEASNLPITEDGHFMAYKKIRKDYKDIHSGTMDNSPGKIVEMPRDKVNPDRMQTCSYGLHFCSKSYLPHFGNSYGSRIVLVKINPKDVVSIPADYDNAKGRACRYEVISEHVGEPESAFNKSVYDMDPEEQLELF